MKKAIVSPICSAFVIPGLGQIINQNFKKGGIILSAVFVLFLAGVVKLFGIIHALAEGNRTTLHDPASIPNKLGAQNLSLLWALLVIFGFLWVYSVIDAFQAGRRLDQTEKGQ